MKYIHDAKLGVVIFINDFEFKDVAEKLNLNNIISAGQVVIENVDSAYFVCLGESIDLKVKSSAQSALYIDEEFGIR